MRIGGNDNCFVCGYKINWVAIISEGNMNAFSINDSEIRGEAIAVGNVLSSDGDVDYEILVNCPRCRNKNKYKTLGRRLGR